MTCSHIAAVTVLLTVGLSVQSLVLATKETVIPVNDVGEGSQCDQDQKTANACLACVTLPFNKQINLVDCCTDEYALAVCSACVDNHGSCIKFFNELDEDSNREDLSDSDSGKEGKRFGRLFMKTPSRYLGRQKRYGRLFMKSPSRYRRLFFGKRSDDDMYSSDDVNSLDKRYGHLFIGSGKRDSESITNTDDTVDLDKRYGRLYLGSGRYFGKRDNAISDDYFDTPDKRYGRLYLGSGGYFGKRDETENPFSDDFSDTPNKRYGRLYLGSGGYFGKRDGSEDYLDTPDKRYGRLYIGSGGYFGKRAGDDKSMWDDYLEETPDKRYGRLFFGRGIYGKRDSVQNDNDIDKRFGPLFIGSGGYFGKYGKRSFETDDTYNQNNFDKRYGRLFLGSNGVFGKREGGEDTDLSDFDFERHLPDLNAAEVGNYNDGQDISMDKRYGRLFLGGGFGRLFKKYKG